MGATTTPSSGRERIVQAAAARFLAQGFTGTSLRDVAADAGMKAGSLYYHFDSKDDLLREVLDEGVGVMHTAFDEVLAATADDAPADRLRAHVRAHLSVLFERGPLTAVHVTAFHTLPAAVREAAMPTRDAYERRWGELLDELRRDGALRGDLDPSLVRLTLLGAMNFAVEWFDPTRDNVDELADVVATQFWQGAAADPDTAREAA